MRAGTLMASVPLLLLLFPLPLRCFGLQLCTNSMAPKTLKTPLRFCSYNGSSCCNSTDDAALEKQFQAMNISDSACAAVMKSILCAKCDPYSFELFNTGAKPGTIPNLCNSLDSSISVVTKDSNKTFCGDVWDTCKEVPMWNSPFAGLPVVSSKLTDIWQSEADFCKAFGGSSGDSTLCFDGNPVSFDRSIVSPPPNGLCLERIGNGSYLNMVAHPDGSNRVFLSNQAGKIWLASVPEYGSGGTLEIDESNPFLDLTDEVHFDAELGLMGIAFHPNFTKNGRFFVSYNCDKLQSRSCSGTCACNSYVGCDPSNLGTDQGAQPCQFHAVVAEYTANDSTTTPSTAKNANPLEVRRIFTMGLPYTTHHAGQVLFGPADGYLYFMMGDGGNKGDPFNFAQNKKSLLGKIMRLDINDEPGQNQISDLGLWGNYSIPKDNPYTVDSELAEEVFALGLRNPWRCSFDSERPPYFFCADVGQDTYEEVDLISKGGNYGWRVYEGYALYHSQSSPGGNTSLGSIDAIFPVMGYSHSDINTTGGSASITGGCVYRSMTDPCMHGKYLYADLYGEAMWAGTEVPENSGNYTSNMIPFSCAKNSPILCDRVAESPFPSLGFIFSFGEDNKKDVFILSSNGVYRIIPPSRCNYSCPSENITDNGSSTPGPPSSACKLEPLLARLVVILFMFLSCRIWL